METHLFKQQIKALKARYYRLVFIRAALFSAVFLSFFALLITGLQRMAGVGFNTGNAFFIAGLIAVFPGVLGTVILKKTFFQELILADHRLKLMDRLSTACECLEKKASGPVAACLMKEASATVTSYGPAAIFPFKRPKWIYLFFIFSGLSLLLYLDVFPIHPPKAEKAVNPELAAVSRQMDAYGSQMLKKDKKQDKIARQIQETAQQLVHSNQTQKDALRSLSGLLEVMEKDVRNTLDQLENQLAMEDAAEGIPLPSREPGGAAQENQIQIELEAVTDKIEDAFDRQVPDELADALAEMENSLDFQNFLKQMIKTLEETPQKQQDAQNDPEEERTSPDPESPGKNRDKADGAIGEPRENKDTQTYYAGKKKADPLLNEPEPVLSSKGQVVKDRIGVYDRGALAYSIRALSSMGLSGKTEQQIQKEYTQQNEAVLLKEKIPVEYREMIRDYFLSIGLE